MTEVLPVVVVDDDEIQLEAVSAVLRGDGYVVHCFSDVTRALDHCAVQPPALVLSDVIMPGTSGFDLQARYARRFPERSTPFVFLSSLGDASAIVRGLEAGAGDFLRKPIEPAVLKAKVRAILRRRRRAASSSFRGDLSRFALPSLLRFCEAQGLTGFVDVFAGDVLISLRFRAGQIDDPDAEGTLTRLTELTAAPFVVHSAPVDFDALGDRHAPRRSLPPQLDRPLGRVSSVRLNRTVFQIQTETSGEDPPFVVSVVTIDGRSVWKHSQRAPAGAGPREIAAMIDAQHDQIEGRFNDHFTAQLVAKQRSDPGRREEFHRLFDEGFDRFRVRDYGGAIERWERALAIDPSSAALRVNVNVARGKLGAKA